MAIRFFETANVYLNRVFSIRLVIFLLHFKGVALRTLGGL